jgi:hypothetical protein
MAHDFISSVRPHLEGRLGSGEKLEGIIAGTHQRTFSGSLYAIGVTDRRLILQELDRKLGPKGEPLLITPETLASAEIDGAGNSWSVPSIILDLAAIALTLRTTDGTKMKLMMMKGGGGLFGKLGGGEDQQRGILALIAWMQRRFP